MTVQVRGQKYPANTFAFLNTSNVDVMLYYEMKYQDSLSE